MQKIEEELQSQLTDALGMTPVTEPTSGGYFELLQRRFPTCGSKIDWSSVPGSRVKTVDPQDAAVFRHEGARFFEDIRSEAALADDLDVVIIGDSAMDMAIHVPVKLLGRCLPLVLDMPQYTYILPKDGSWCVSFTMEGDFCFGHSSS